MSIHKLISDKNLLNVVFKRIQSLKMNSFFEYTDYLEESIEEQDFINNQSLSSLLNDNIESANTKPFLGIIELDTNLNIEGYNENAFQLVSENFDVHLKEFQAFKDVIIKSKVATSILSCLEQVQTGKTVEFFWDALINKSVYSTKWAFAQLHKQDNQKKIVLVITKENYNKELFTQLKESEERWKFALEGGNQAVWDWDLTDNTIYHTKKLNELFDYPAFRHFSVLDWHRNIHPKDYPEVILKFRNHLNQKTEIFEAEYRLKRQDGSYIWISDLGKVVKRNENGKPIRFIGTYVDISERKKNEALIIETQERYELVLKSIDTGVWEWNITEEGGDYLSDRFLELLGYSRDEMPNDLSYFVQNFVHVDDIERLQQSLIEHFRYKTPHKIEYRLLTKKLGYRWFIAAGKALFDNNDRAYRMVGSIVDIHTRKTIEEQLRERDHLLNSINQNINEGLFRASKEGKIIYVNQAFMRLFGIEKLTEFESEETYKSFYVKPEEFYRLRDLVRQKGSFKNIEVQFKDKNGKLLWGLASSNLTIDKDGVFIDGTIRDISDIKHIQEELEEAKKRAEEMNKLKSNFLANMSHEIRTPINGILGLAEIIALDADIDQIHQYSKMIHESGNRLLNTITSILNLSRLEAEQGQFTVQRLDLVNYIEKTKDVFGILAERKSLEFEFNALSKELEIMADKSMIDQVINNLVGNSIEFTKRGKISLELKCAELHSIKMALIEVKDTGIGIEPEFIPKLFNAFEQESTGTSRAFEGSGLGLAICKKYIELLGGDILVESVKNEGSTFKAYIPLCSDNTTCDQEH